MLNDSWVDWGYQINYWPRMRDTVWALRNNPGIFAWDIANEVNVSNANDRWLVGRLVDFYTRQFVDAIAPSNFAVTNPEVIRATLESGGDTQVRYLKYADAEKIAQKLKEQLQGATQGQGQAEQGAAAAPRCRQDVVVHRHGRGAEADAPGPGPQCWVDAGDLDQAKALYAPSRIAYERIERPHLLTYTQCFTDADRNAQRGQILGLRLIQAGDVDGERHVEVHNAQAEQEPRIGQVVLLREMVVEREQLVLRHADGRAQAAVSGIAMRDEGIEAVVATGELHEHEDAAAALGRRGLGIGGFDEERRSEA